MKDSTHNFLLILIGIVLLLWSLLHLLDSFGGDGGIFGKLVIALFWAVTLTAAVGFLRRRGWAFLYISVGLLGYFMSRLIRFILAFDSEDVTIRSQTWPLLLTMLLIAYLGREKMEVRFRPELDIDHH